MGDKVIPAKGNVLGSLIPARYILAILGSIGMAIIYGLKVNLSVALVAMTNHTAVAILANSTTTETENGPFIWDSVLQGTILSCYFWGYFISQIPGAYVAEHFSAKWVMFFSVAINIVCTLLTPIMAELHYGGVLLMRFAEGVGGGVTFPSMHVMLASWAPPVERSIMASIVYAGTSLGTVISMLMAGQLAGAYGWASIFYVMGGLSCIWIVLWIWLIQDTPNQQPLISVEERQLITSSLGVTTTKKQRKPSLPWKRILKSKPFWAILVAHICSNWGWYMVLIELPIFMKHIFSLNIKQNAVVSSVPFFTMWLFSMALSKTLDTLRTKGIINTSVARKIATLFASAVPLLCLLLICEVVVSITAVIFLMGLAVTCIGGMFCGFLSNHIDIAPNFAGTLIAITNTLATLPGILVPVFVGQITEKSQTMDEWRIVFYVTIVLYVIEILAFTIFASGDEQPWNKELSTDDDRIRMEEEGTPLKSKDGKNYD